MPARSKKKGKVAASPEANVCANCGVQEGQHGAILSKCRKCKATLYCIKQVCPICREELPPDPGQLFEEGCRLFFVRRTGACSCAGRTA